MSDPSATSPADLSDDPQMTVAQLQAWLDQLQRQLTHTTAEVSALSTWCVGLPRRHHPDPVPVLVTDLIQTTAPDPSALTRHIHHLVQLTAQIDHITAAARTIVDTETGPFRPSPSPTTIDTDTRPTPAPQAIQATANLVTAYGDDPTFEAQRHAARRALTFDGRRTWRGALSCTIQEDLPRWQALVDAATAGAVVHLHPEPPGPASEPNRLIETQAPNATTGGQSAC